MPKYLFQGRYVGDGLKSLLQDGGSSRREAIEKLTNSVGGTIEAFYFSFGESDVYVVADLPNNETSAALSLMVSASGAVDSKVTVLLTPEEIDKAAKIRADYQPPSA